MSNSHNPLLLLVVTLAGAYLIIVVATYLFQSRLIYMPELPTRKLVTTPALLGMSYEDVTINTEDNVALHAWYVPVENAKKTLLFFHGNAGNISHRLQSIQIFHDLGLSVLIIDYRGYGKSEGKISEAGTYRDARAAWNYLVSTRGIGKNNIIIFGRSLGAAIAAQLASHTRPGGIILESAFSSTVEMARTIYWYLPVRLLARIHYPTVDYITQVSCPVLVIHSKQDEIVPYRHGRQIFDAAPEPKYFLELKGGHNDSFSVSQQHYVAGLNDFLASIR